MSVSGVESIVERENRWSVLRSTVIGKEPMKIINATIVTAFSESAIGTKIVNPSGFRAHLADAIGSTDFAAQRVPGQAFLTLPEAAYKTVSAGVGRRTLNPSDYVCREYRGRVGAFLKREHAAPVEGLAAVVYTVEAYLADPDVAGDESEVARVRESGATHVLVAPLAFAGPKAPYPAWTLLHNLAGGNKEALVWSADEIRAKAKETEEYWSEWAVVAD